MRNESRDKLWIKNNFCLRLANKKKLFHVIEAKKEEEKVKVHPRLCFFILHLCLQFVREELYTLWLKASLILFNVVSCGGIPEAQKAFSICIRIFFLGRKTGMKLGEYCVVEDGWEEALRDVWVCGKKKIMLRDDSEVENNWRIFGDVCKECSWWMFMNQKRVWRQWREDKIRGIINEGKLRERINEGKI